MRSGCCTRAASGHAAAAPPSSAPRTPAVPCRTWEVPPSTEYRILSLPPTPWQVLGADLNCSESSRQPACPRLSLPPPALGERRHRGLARRRVANALACDLRVARRRGYTPWTPDWRGGGPYDALATTAVRASYSG